MQGEIIVKKYARIVSLIITVLMVLQSVAVFNVSADGGVSQQGATGNYFNMSVDNSGWDIYNPESITAGMGYRYGASMIKNADGSIDAWFACKGDGQGKTTGILDFISYKHSPDGGHTWGNEKIVLAPTALSADCKSCCDPGVIHFGGYYYIGYTATLDYAGYANNIFVARSVNPDGPYEKWNGTGWGGTPAPLIYNNLQAGNWGIAEPSFVKVGNKLYIYYSECCFSGLKNYIRVCVADAENENWPATVGYTSAAVTVPQGEGKQSGFDVKYDEATGKFIGMNIWNGLTASPCLKVFTSNDGRTFTQTDTVYTNIIKYAQNNGITGDEIGHFNSNTDKLYLSYAYGSVRGRWATRMAPVTITLSNSVDTSDSTAGLLTQSVTQSTLSRHTIGVTTRPHYYIKAAGDSFTVIPYTMSDSIVGSKITDTQNVTFSGYNSKIVSFNGMTGTIKQRGTTVVTMHYKGFTGEFTVKGYDAGTDVTSTAVAKIEPIFYIGQSGAGTMTVYLDQDDNAGLRSMMQTYNGKIGEGSNNPYSHTVVFDSNSYVVNYVTADTSIVEVYDNFGQLWAKRTGSTIAAVSCNGSDPYYINIDVVASKNPVNVPLSLSGGTCSETVKVVQGYKYGPLPTPTKAGYEFVGWFTQDGTRITSSTRVTSANHNRLYARWQQHTHSYTLTDSAASTCTVGGYNTYTCSSCGNTYTDNLAPLGHDYVSTVTAPTCTAGGYTTYVCSRCKDTYVADSTAALGHSFGEWVEVTPATATTDGLKHRVCVRCDEFEEEVIPATGEVPTGDVDVSVNNYTITFTNAANINAIRIASGNLTTSGEIKNAPGCININSSVIAAGTDAAGNYNYELPDGGIWSVWYKTNDGGQFIVSGLDNTVMTQSVDTYGVTMTVNNLCGVKDFFVAKGHYDTYRGVKNAEGSFSVTSAKFGSAHSYKYGAAVGAPGEYTICIRYNDTSRPDAFLYFNCEVETPTVDVFGKNITVGNIDDIRVIRVAPGTFATSNAVKNAEGCRNFTANAIAGLANADGSLTVNNAAKEDGSDNYYTVSIEYKNLYTEIHNITVNKLMPEYTVNGGSITLTNLEGLDILRYASGTYTTANGIKNAPGAQYVKGANVQNGTVTLTGLSGTYSFLVQYTENSKNIFTIEF